jgi:PBP1b-binding outer membrane lipoprotein LpoB
MKTMYVIAVLVALLFVVGCSKSADTSDVKTTTAPAAPTAPAATEPAAQPAETATVASPTGNAPVLNTDQAVIDRLTKACQAGNAGVCATLKNKYGLEVKPGSQEAAEVPAVE